MSKQWFKQYQQGVPETVDIHQYRSIVQILDDCFERFAERPAFHNMGKHISFADLDDLSARFANFLQKKLGLRQGDRVALMMPNIMQYPVALFGVLRAGMVVVNVNPLYTERELEHQLRDSGALAIVIFANSAHLMEKVREKTDVKHIVVTGIGDMLGFPKAWIVNFVIKSVKKMVPLFSLPDAHSFMDTIGVKDTSFDKPDFIHDDIAFLQYTGGTTGVSKGAMLTHGNIVSNILQAKAWLSMCATEGKEIIITALPLYHIFSLTANCFVYSAIGALNVLITNPRDIPAFVKELAKFKFTALTGVNTLFNALLNNAEFSKLDFSHMRVSLGGGMAVQKAVAERWREVTGKTLIEAYGLTETSPAALMNPMDLKAYNGFIGLPIPNTDVRILDDANQDLAANEVGEICIKGPQVMKGYWNRPEETEEVMTPEGYFKTGDLGYMNEDGFVKLVDRKNDMIVVSGFNVYPNEIEDVVVTHPKIFECAAIGVADEKSGETVKLFVVKEDPSLTEEEIIRHCEDRLTRYKIPKWVEFRDELPKSNVGKVLRKDLR